MPWPLSKLLLGNYAKTFKPSSALGEAVYRKAVELEPHISEAYILIQKSLSPGNSLDKKVELITDSYSRVKMFSAQILPEVIKERRLLIEIRNGYNAEVLKITKYINEAKIGGEALENIARKANEMRRNAGEYYKNKTPELIRKEIYNRNLVEYTDELGPTFEVMVQAGLAKGKSLDTIYSEIIERSQRTNENLNIFLNVLAKEMP